MNRYSKVAFILALCPSFFLSSCNPPSSAEIVELEQPGPTSSKREPSPTQTSINPMSPAGQIAYIGSDGNIYRYSPVDDTTWAVTDDASRGLPDSVIYIEPTWGAKGGELSYIRSEIEPDGGSNFSIHLDQDQEKESLTIYESEYSPFYMFWSPRGTYLSFLESTRENTLSFRVLRRGGDVIFEDQGQPYYWDWGQNEEVLISHVGGSFLENPQNARISRTTLGSGVIENLDIVPLQFQAPAYAPDRTSFLASAMVSEDSAGLFLLEPSGEVISRVMPSNDFMAYDWSPNGRTIAVNTGPMFAGIQLGELTLFSVEERSDPSILNVIDETVVAFWWSPAGDQIVYFKPQVVPVVESQSISFPEQSEEELLIEMYLYDLRLEQSRKLVTFPPTLEFLRILRYYDQYQRSATIWSPEGSHVVYTSNLGEGRNGIFVLPIQVDGISTKIGEGSHAFWSWE